MTEVRLAVRLFMSLSFLILVPRTLHVRFQAEDSSVWSYVPRELPRPLRPEYAHCLLQVEGRKEEQLKTLNARLVCASGRFEDRRVFTVVT